MLVVSFSSHVLLFADMAESVMTSKDIVELLSLFLFTDVAEFEATRKEVAASFSSRVLLFADVVEFLGASREVATAISLADI